MKGCGVLAQVATCSSTVATFHEPAMTVTAVPTQPASTRSPWYSVLYIQVLIAIAVGILIGHFYPGTGKALKPLGDGFISLIKMMIAPVIFCTIVLGIG